MSSGTIRDVAEVELAEARRLLGERIDHKHICLEMLEAAEFDVDRHQLIVNALVRIVDAGKPTPANVLPPGLVPVTDAEMEGEADAVPESAEGWEARKGQAVELEPVADGEIEGVSEAAPCEPPPATWVAFKDSPPFFGPVPPLRKP